MIKGISRGEPALVPFEQSKLTSRKVQSDSGNPFPMMKARPFRRMWFSPTGRFFYSCNPQFPKSHFSIGTAVPLTAIPPVAGISTVNLLGRPIACP